MDLSSLELSYVEEKLFKIVLFNKDIVVKRIVELSGHDKKVVYENLEKLQRKGLISSIVKERTRHYSFTGTTQINSLIEQEEQLLKEKKEKTTVLINEIKNIEPELQESSQTELLVGKQSIRQLFQSILNEKEYVVIGVPIESEKILGKVFWENFHLKQKERTITSKMIFNPSLRSWKPHNKNLQIKYLEVEPLTETIIFKDKIAIIIWTQDPSATIIRSKTVAKSYRSFFNLIWEQAKK